MIKERIKNKFIKTETKIIKEPVEYPVLYGDLLNKKVAFITGGNSGIGLEIAKSFIRNGASVIIAARNKEKNEKAINILKKIAKKNQIIDSVIIDFEKIDKSLDIVKKYLESSKKKIDILVNCAGIGIGESIGNTKIDDYEKVLKVNLESVYFLSQLLYEYMKKNNIKGNILNITSSSSNRPANTPYCVAKWGEKGLTLGMAKKFIQDGIVVNAIAPGPTATAMLKVDSKEGIDLPNNPSKRYCMPEEIANMAVVLVSDLSKMIVGDTIYMTGGAATITYDDVPY